jgi:formate--tetrahydrofolate ligase
MPLRDIRQVATDLEIPDDDLIVYGRHMAKVRRSRIGNNGREPGRIVLVSAINPTPAGEGKTTTSIGLAQGLVQAGASACVALREPSLGPVFGVKGGGCGGGRSTIEPSDRINLHFTGDLHAISSAHNLLAAVVDNHLFRGSASGLDARRVLWKRVMDMNDRALRKVMVGMGGHRDGVPRESGFDITAASELMAILALVEDLGELKEQVGRILVGYTQRGAPVTAAEMGVQGAMAALLRDALDPNLVQTCEGVPAFVHTGPFGNIAHGCNSVLATRMALAHADFVVTEAGFGFDLGAEKFLDIKCRKTGLWPSAIVIVVTVRALKMHGGASRRELHQADGAALERGLANLEAHLDNVREFGLEPIVAINRFGSDAADELRWLCDQQTQLGVPVVLCDPFGEGGAGCAELAELVRESVGGTPPTPRYLYDLADPIETKIETIATRIYGAQSVSYTVGALRKLRRIRRLGYDQMPICMAKHQASLSDDPSLVGAPQDFVLTVRDVRISAGAGFLVPLTGDITTMPGLSAHPAAEDMDLAEDGRITGMS